MICKILFGASLASLLLVNAPVITHAQQNRPPSQTPNQNQQATKSVSGKIANIGDNGKSFTLDVDNGGGKQSMQFVLDKNTRVVGRVTTGTMVTVEYQPMNGDQNLCVKISAQQS